jgi:Tfp pilus assembly protein PilW
MQRGFTLVEFLIASAVAITLLGAAVMLLNSAMFSNTMVTQITEAQQNLRAGVNLMVADVLAAGTSIPVGGVSIPSGTGSSAVRRPGLAVPFPVGSGVISAVTPGDGLGPVINGVSTDAVTLLEVDDRRSFAGITLALVSGTADQLTYPASAQITSGAAPMEIGDLLLVSNANAANPALGLVTFVAGDIVTLSAGDSMNVNQPGAEFGNIATLANPGGPPYLFPPTTAVRIRAISYYIDATDPNNPRLMRAVNGRNPQVVADAIENLQVSYDIYDLSGAVTANLADPASPNQIRKVNIFLTARSRDRGRGNRDFYRISAGTQLSVRNLAFRDRYQ